MSLLGRGDGAVVAPLVGALLAELDGLDEQRDRRHVVRAFRWGVHPDDQPPAPHRQRPHQPRRAGGLLGVDERLEFAPHVAVRPVVQLQHRATPERAHPR
jgi:hypothetical protein